MSAFFMRLSAFLLTGAFFCLGFASNRCEKIFRGLEVNQMLKKVQGFLVSVPAVAAGFIGTAQAEVPAAVTTALETVKTDTNTVGGFVLTIIVGIAAYMFIRKVLH
ncbi:MAG: major capsid protein [Candidatus Competibacter denitrificans]